MIATVIIRCVVHMPGGVLSDASVLTLESSIPLSRSALCRFPGPYPAQVSHLPCRLTPPPETRSGGDWPDADWGMVNGIGSVTINALGVEFQFRPGELTSDKTIDQAADLDKELNVWAARLRSWLSVLAQGPTGYMFELGIVTWPTDIQHELQSDAYAAGRLYEPRQVSEWQWRHALAHSANGDSPIAARALLATAATNTCEENYRPAVLDAATAAELTLTKGIADKIKTHGADTKLSELLLKNKTLGALIQLARDFHMTLPPDVNKNLVEKRNKVTHQGYIPTREDASEAIRVAQIIVTTLDPFPIHCDEEASYLGIQGISEDD
jgi:hypothetical protein